MISNQCIRIMDRIRIEENGVIDRIGASLYSTGGEVICAGFYVDKTPAFISIDGNGNQELKITVCLDIVSARGCVWVKTWGENEGIEKALETCTGFKPTGRHTPAGFATALEYRLSKNMTKILVELLRQEWKQIEE